MAGEFEYVVRPRDQDGTRYFLVEETKGNHELAPWFECYTTAAEIALKATRGDPHVNRIPACPVGTPIPRPSGHVFVPNKKAPTHPQLGSVHRKK